MICASLWPELYCSPWYISSITHTFALCLSPFFLIYVTEVVIGIKMFAFRNSVYPLILSIENHCCMEQQQKMADIFNTLLGKMLLKPSDYPLVELPSPEDLKYKIIIKGKRNEVTGFEADDAEDEFDEFDEADLFDGADGAAGNEQPSSLVLPVMKRFKSSGAILKAVPEERDAGALEGELDDSLDTTRLAPLGDDANLDKLRSAEEAEGALESKPGEGEVT